MIAEGTAQPYSRNSPSWVVVAGSLHRRGGMDRANLELVQYLANQGNHVHVVAHQIDSALAGDPLVTFYPARNPAGAFMLGEYFLGARGAEVARTITANNPGARVVVNGGNCRWPDINWVHCVHHAWPCRDDGAPAWFRLKNRAKKALARRAEKLALRRARLVIANSERTRRDLIATINLDPALVHTIYLGADSANIPPTPAARLAARQRLRSDSGRPLVAFVGALGYDLNKGFDTLWAAWRSLSADSRWDANLLVAGGGRATSAWREKIARAGLQARVTFLGLTDRVADVLDAADLLVSPVRYEGYGLNVQEALCRGTPAMVSACAGVAELYPSSWREMLIPNPEDSDDLARRLVAWRGTIDHWKPMALELGSQLRQYTWRDMARKIFDAAAASATDWSRQTSASEKLVAQNSSMSAAN